MNFESVSKGFFFVDLDTLMDYNGSCELVFYDTILKKMKTRDGAGLQPYIKEGKNLNSSGVKKFFRQLQKDSHADYLLNLKDYDLQGEKISEPVSIALPKFLRVKLNDGGCKFLEESTADCFAQAKASVLDSPIFFNQTHAEKNYLVECVNQCFQLLQKNLVACYYVYCQQNQPTNEQKNKNIGYELGLAFFLASIAYYIARRLELGDYDNIAYGAFLKNVGIEEFLKNLSDPKSDFRIRIQYTIEQLTPYQLKSPIMEIIATQYDAMHEAGSGQISHKIIQIIEVLYIYFYGGHFQVGDEYIFYKDGTSLSNAAKRLVEKSVLDEDSATAIKNLRKLKKTENAYAEHIVFDERAVNRVLDLLGFGYLISKYSQIRQEITSLCPYVVIFPGLTSVGCFDDSFDEFQKTSLCQGKDSVISQLAREDGQLRFVFMKCREGCRRLMEINRTYFQAQHDNY